MKFLKIENPCTESWENMHEISGGRFCDLCSKKVVDLTLLSDSEILKILDQSEGNICGHISRSRLQKPLINIEEVTRSNPDKERIVFSKFAAGLTLATTLTGVGFTDAPASKIEVVQEQNSKTTSSEIHDQQDEKFKTGFQDVKISGRVLDSKTKEPLKNVKISLVTIEKVHSVFTNKNGEFSLIVPQFTINKKNVLVAQFDKFKSEKEHYSRYDETTITVSKENLNQVQIIVDNRAMIDGMISAYHRNYDPTVFVDGEEISYDDFKDFSQRDYNIFYFYGSTAKTIYSAADDDLIVAFSK